MRILKKENNGVTTVVVEGRLDTGTAPELENKLVGFLPTCKALVFDFAKLEYISSAGLRVLLTAQKTMKAHNGKMEIINANDVVRDVFNLTGFAAFLNIK